MTRRSLKGLTPIPTGGLPRDAQRYLRSKDIAFFLSGDWKGETESDLNSA